MSGSILSDHFIKQWDLALVDVALYRPDDISEDFIVVPHLRNRIESEPRHVVRVVVEGESPRARVEIERFSADEQSTVRQKWDEDRFFRHLDLGHASDPVVELAMRLRDLTHNYPESMSLAWGTGREGSMVVKRNNGGIVEIHGLGRIKFRPRKFGRALGEDEAARYQQALEDLIPSAMQMTYPTLSPDESRDIAARLGDLIERTVERVETGRQ